LIARSPACEKRFAWECRWAFGAGGPKRPRSSSHQRAHQASSRDKLRPNGEHFFGDGGRSSASGRVRRGSAALKEPEAAGAWGGQVALWEVRVGRELRLRKGAGRGRGDGQKECVLGGSEDELGLPALWASGQRG
jgi:hypothetical protein